jgi:hypothetical protein
MRIPHGRVLAAMAGIVVVSAAALSSAATGDTGSIKLDVGNGRIPLRAAMASQWQAEKPAEFGFSDSGPGFLKATGAAAEAGSSVARFAVSWTNIWEHGFENLDRVVSLLRANGVRPLLTVSDAPPWAAPDAFVDGRFYIRPPDPEFDNEFAAFYATLAARYPEAILQVWSEPNLAFYGQIPPDRYVELVETAAAAVHMVNPQQTVIGASPSPGDDAWRQYMRAVYSSISDPSINVGVNLYPRRGRSLDRAMRRLSKDFQRVKKIARGRPIWVTETGLAAIQFGAKRQAKGSVQIYKILAGGNAEAIIFHRLIDPDDQINEWEDSLGALEADTTPNLLYTKLRALRLRDLEEGR